MLRIIIRGGGAGSPLVDTVSRVRGCMVLDAVSVTVDAHALDAVALDAIA